ncbi:MAG: hypothetical protein J6S61_02115, partial [Elusimicrobiaceae bacterium]|nr:hypothetical protein [Elusimicrobiaceae bacterium]
AKRACKFEPFFIFIFLEYRKLTAFVLLLGTRRRGKNQNFFKNTCRTWEHGLVLLNFLRGAKLLSRAAALRF